MSSPSRKRVTVIASIEGVKTAEKTLIRLGFESKSNFAKSQLLARNAVTKFFKRDPIQLDSFKRICDGLKIDWREILESDSTTGVLEQARVGHPGISEGSVSTVSQREESMQAVVRRVTVVNQQNEVKAVITLQGDITSIDASFKSTLEVLLSHYTGCVIQVTNIQAGSIRITIKGDQQGIERLVEQIAAGELTDIDDFPVENIHLLSEELLEESEESNSWNKWNVIQEILRNPKTDRELQNIDLSDADLSRANLSRANLSGADFRGTDLISADLSGAILVGAILRSAILNDANLISANLISADLISANLSGAILRSAILNGAILRTANLSRANLWGADLSGANLWGANLNGANLNGANLNGANLNGADFSYADLSGADFSYADLCGAVIDEKTQIDHKWRLVWTIVNQGAEGANLRGVDLSRANLRSVDLRGANLSDANLSGANLSGVINLSDANLSGADLSDADLSYADLSYADLRSADLRSADLSRANLRGANVTDALLGNGLGLVGTEKQNLAQRGAIFDDAPGDRSSTPSPSPTRR